MKNTTKPTRPGRGCSTDTNLASLLRRKPRFLSRFVAAMGVMLAVSTCLSLSASAAVIVSQTNGNSTSGSANYGQEIRLDILYFPGFSTVSLDSLTFTKAGSGTASETMYIDVFQGNDATETTPDFSDPDTTGLTYLGSSITAVNYNSTGSGGDLVWTFSGIILDFDRDVYLVLSDDSSEGSFLGARLRIQDDTGTLAYNNIANGDSGPLFGGIGDLELNQDNYYSISVTPIPEPAALALLGLGSLAMFTRRQKTNVTQF